MHFRHGSSPLEPSGDPPSVDVDLDFGEAPVTGTLRLVSAGRWLYAAQYRSGELVRIDPRTLEVVGRVVLGPQLEGLAVDPTGDRLFGIHKNAGLSVVDLASLTAVHLDGFSGYYIELLGSSQALIGGNGLLGRVNLDTRQVDWSPLSAGHFSVFPGGDRFVSLVYSSLGVPYISLEILSLPGLDPLLSIPLEDLFNAVHVAVDPTGDLIYALGQAETGVRFMAFDAATGEVVTSMSVGGSRCGIYCAQTPS